MQMERQRDIQTDKQDGDCTHCKSYEKMCYNLFCIYDFATDPGLRKQIYNQRVSNCDYSVFNSDTEYLEHVT